MQYIIWDVAKLRVIQKSIPPPSPQKTFLQYFYLG